MVQKPVRGGTLWAAVGYSEVAFARALDLDVPMDDPEAMSRAFVVGEASLG